MDFFHKNQKTILVLVLLGAGIYFYLTFFKPEGGTTPIPQDANAEQVGNEVLALYNSLQSVSLDQGLFNYSLYKNLIDFSVPVPYQTPGRRNPFNVIGQD